ncbi:hypothetical protein VM1G_02582 [Cytospora mali]|uniref:Endonuclease/exonuclease/phosphatase domain-containing protein n=1 Tax=Cytospora mali TaxID=578113 RepID=A0A194VUP1_CYTMA|nr:hypothetical protein VM1G_02582 [Valsa mali]
MASSSLIASLTRKQLEKYVPTAQPHYTFNGSKWQLADPDFSTALSNKNTESPINNLRIITWNIDFMAPFPRARMASALSYLQGLVGNIPTATALVICLQELRQVMPIDFEDPRKQFDPQIADDLGQIAAAEWVQQRFNVSDLSTEYWRCSYNGVTLVDRRLAIAKVARLPFVSEYQREALMVDIVAKQPSENGGQEPELVGENRGKKSVIRICNVHLDSMAGNPPMRPVQWKACAKYMQDKSGGVVAGIVAGDCNANRAYDLTLPQENGFKDAYLEMGGKEGDPEGLTWGPQSKRTRFPHKRMDKVCFWQDETDSGNVPLQLRGLERIGVGVKVEDEVADQLLEAGYLGFVTDHYGLMADVEVSDGWTLST